MSDPLTTFLACFGGAMLLLLAWIGGKVVYHACCEYEQVARQREIS